MTTHQDPPGGDRLYRFLFEGLDLRGECVRMDAGWRTALSRNDYPAAVAEQLGQGLAAAVLLSATIKFEGSLILHVQGDGPVQALVAQATHERTFRGIARWREGAEAATTNPFGQGTLLLTIAPADGNRVQGMIGLEGNSLAAALESYFAQSEQLPTRLWLAADGERAAGLLLQALPGAGGGTGEVDWERIGLLAATVTPREMLDLPPEELLHRLFHQERIRLFAPEPVAFRCNCSRDRIADTLRSMGRGEVEGIVREHGLVEAICEFCGHRYAFDAVDVAGLFVAGMAEGSETRQ